MPKTIMDIPRSVMLPLYPVPQTRPPPKPPDNLSKKQEVDSSKIEIEENSPFQVLCDVKLIGKHNGRTIE